ncbi:MAG: cation transporter dimerization domain-containing protein, partial [Thermoproteota archaeon]
YAALAYTLSIDLTRIFVLGPRVDGRALTVKVAFYHALSDLCSTLIALFGFWLSTYGILYGDLLASLTLSAALVFLSSRLVWSSIMELSDVAPREVVTRVKEHIEKASSGLFAYEGLRVRGAGNKFFVRATLKFPDYMRLEEAHEIVTRIEEDILKTLREADILFHIEPSGIRGMPTREFIRRVASEVEGVIDVHDIDITRHDGKTYVSLHIQTDPKRSLSKAHEIAEMVEKAIHLSMSGIESVFIHMEPSTVELRRGSAMSDQEISEVIQSVIRKCRDKIRVRRVVTYVTNGRRQANIECIFDESIPIEEAHRITLEIEDKIRREISETTVTVHMEPG